MRERVGGGNARAHGWMTPDPSTQYTTPPNMNMLADMENTTCQDSRVCCK